MCRCRLEYHGYIYYIIYPYYMIGYHDYIYGITGSNAMCHCVSGVGARMDFGPKPTAPPLTHASRGVVFHFVLPLCVPEVRVCACVYMTVCLHLPPPLNTMAVCVYLRVCAPAYQPVPT